MPQFHAGSTEDGTQGTCRPTLFADDFAEIAGGDAKAKHGRAGVLIHVYDDGIRFVDKRPRDFQHEGSHIVHGALLRLYFHSFSHSHTSTDVAGRAFAYRAPGRRSVASGSSGFLDKLLIGRIEENLSSAMERVYGERPAPAPTLWAWAGCPDSTASGYFRHLRQQQAPRWGSSRRAAPRFPTSARPWSASTRCGHA